MNSGTYYDKPGSDRQWWLTEGAEICSVCEAAVHPETLGFCVECDQGICTLCIRWSEANGPLRCPACAVFRLPDDNGVEG